MSGPHFRSMSMTLSGSGWVDCTEWLPNGELRGLTKLIKITEGVRRYATEQGVAENEVVKRGLEKKSTEFAKSDEVYRKT